MIVFQRINSKEDKHHRKTTVQQKRKVCYSYLKIHIDFNCLCIYCAKYKLCSEFVSLLVLSSLLFFSVSFVCVFFFILGIQVLTWDCLYTNALFFLKAWVLFGGYVSGIWSHQCCKLLHYNVRFLKQAEPNTWRETRNKDPASPLISFFNIAYFTILPGTGAPHSWIMWKFKRASTWKW